MIRNSESAPAALTHLRPGFFAAALAAVALLCAGGLSAAAADQSGPDLAKLQKMQQQAVDFLRNSQSDDGSWTAPQAVGITALTTTALLENGVPADDPSVARGLKFLESQIREDGGIYFEKTTHRNYETCISLLAFAAANENGRYDKTIANAEKFLRGLQWDEGEGLESSDEYYGGAGYGGHKRPDMSNTQFLLEALRTAGVKSDDPSMQKALTFVSRSQNLESEHNTTEFAAKVNDGGFYYTPAAGGTSQAGMTDNGGLRSYGSMTYAGLKSMIYAGLTSDDPRVKAALNWIRQHYSVTDNPGMGKTGLFYYYHTFARSLDVLGIDMLEDAQGQKHDWRKDLVNQLAELQRSNGSFINTEATRWYEGDPNLATTYALLALSHCQPEKSDSKAPKK